VGHGCRASQRCPAVGPCSIGEATVAYRWATSGQGGAKRAIGEPTAPLVVGLLAMGKAAVGLTVAKGGATANAACSKEWGDRANLSSSGHFLEWARDIILTMRSHLRDAHIELHPMLVRDPSPLPPLHLSALVGTWVGRRCAYGSFQIYVLSTTSGQASY
jgi:hypothetical protein